ncbi:MAG: N-acetyl-alpha-D-glucosaminyl-diphospho-ditrans,octacis-undecaprenol 4-epimerase [Herbaspirillum frisingense]|uniref:N-acetyl-alpha-D-glucosaminyl-diphospho-ditrans, octacis-undecaprenol 4-epimerase n=1 Tax=Herbaspirillum frisingense TaxID=92645 RepID=A0A7V8JSL2_9BURK|nr:MAG: N-acetyl-alpha-D-glucosaminyl-diphospho-ditrans,octacis-undecaprenol 4-epimerase [Herbaspirillum frisingense]
MSILVTGAAGFLGRTIVQHLCENGAAVRAIVHRNRPSFPAGVEVFPIASLDGQTEWSSALAGASAVVHCAARVHVMKDDAVIAMEQCRRVNTEGTLNLARQAAAAGVKRFIFISTIGVHGIASDDAPFTAESAALPHGPYAQSKWEAEEGLRAICRETGMESVVIRPPLIYGKDAPGNFSSLLRAVNLYLPLPLGAIRNRRSFAAVDNVADLVRCCLTHPSAANQAFLVSDGEDLSSSAFIGKIAVAVGKPSMLLPVPVSILSGLAGLLGKKELVRKLSCSLYLDIEKNRRLLDWRPVIVVDEALRKAVAQ